MESAPRPKAPRPKAPKAQRSAAPVEDVTASASAPGPAADTAVSDQSHVLPVGGSAQGIRPVAQRDASGGGAEGPGGRSDATVLGIVRAVVGPLGPRECPTLVRHVGPNGQMMWTLVRAPGPQMESAWAACRAVDPDLAPEAFLAAVGAHVGSVPEAFRVLSMLELP